MLGTWHDIAIATTCTHIQNHKADAAIGKLVLQQGTTQGKLKMTRTMLRFNTRTKNKIHFQPLH